MMQKSALGQRFADVAASAKEAPPTPEELAKQERRQAREMTMLALSKAFSLRHGLAVADPSGFEEAVEALGKTARSYEEQLAAMVEQEQEAKKRLEEKNAGEDKLNWRLGLLMALGSEEGLPPELKAIKERYEKLQTESSAVLEALALNALRASGALGLLLDESKLGEMAELAGSHKSSQELAVFDEGMENRLDHYSIAARRGPDGGFAGFETVDVVHGERAVLLRDVKEPNNRLSTSSGFFAMPMSFKKMMGDKGAVSAALTLASPPGAAIQEPKVEMDGLFYVSQPLGMDLRNAWDGARNLARACENGAAVSACLAMGREAQKDSELSRAWKALEGVAAKADEWALQDKARRACAWFDSVAGQKSSELAQKVWGGSVPSGMRLGELEILARSSKELWASLEGQEALGLFSIRMSQKLGLELSGRDLAERAKKKMKEAGLSEGGWRLLGKMDSSPQSQTAQWTGLVQDEGGTELDRQIHESFHRLFTRAAGQENLDSPNAKQQMEEVQARRAQQQALQDKQWLAMLAKALTCCASRGMDPLAAERALGALRKQGRRDAELVFGSTVSAPEGASMAEARAEGEAKAARTPKILGDWLSLAARNPEKASEAFQEARDWAREAEWGAWREMPESAGWGEVMARQKRWHDMVQERERSEKASIAWDGVIEGWSDPQTGFSATPLTDGAMLWDEGKAMRHCVSSYARVCERGESLIFSIRKDGERFGTAEVNIEDGSCEVVQFLGAYNAKIDDERAWAAAKATAGACKQALIQKRLAFNQEKDAEIMGALSQKLQARRAAPEEPGVRALGL